MITVPVADSVPLFVSEMPLARTLVPPSTQLAFVLTRIRPKLTTELPRPDRVPALTAEASTSVLTALAPIVLPPSIPPITLPRGERVTLLANPAASEIADALVPWIVPLLLTVPAPPAMTIPRTPWIRPELWLVTTPPCRMVMPGFTPPRTARTVPAFWMVAPAVRMSMPTADEISPVDALLSVPPAASIAPRPLVVS